MKRRQNRAERRSRNLETPSCSMSRRGGFTLIEIMMATVISIMVFVAMGALLTRSFSLWMDAMGNWKLAQHARIARSRMMDGAFYFSAGSNIVVKTGWLSSTNVTKAVASGEAYVQYYPLRATGGAFRAYGWTNAATGKNLRLQSGSSAWVLGQNVAATNYGTDVQVDLFNPAITNNMVVATFRLSFSAMGKTYTQPCAVNAFLVNH